MIQSVDLIPLTYLRSKLDRAYERVMNSGTYIGGHEVKAFEQEWSEYNQQSYCVAVGNGFDATQLLLRAMGVMPGDTVYVPAITAPPVWSAVNSLRATPVPFSVAKQLKTLLVYKEPAIFVNLYGQQTSIDPSFKHSIEDCCQSHGLLPRLTSIASFYPTKNLGCYGDSGAITTNSESLAEYLRSLHNYGSQGAINSRMDPLQAAFLRVKLPYLNDWNRQRTEQALWYNRYLQGYPLTLPDTTIPSVWHQYAISVDTRETRDALKEHLFTNGVQTQIHYPVPPHHLLSYNYDLPLANQWSSTTLSLPIGPHLKPSAIHLISVVIQEFFHKRCTNYPV